MLSRLTHAAVRGSRTPIATTWFLGAVVGLLLLAMAFV
jgi:hypothetical protein